MFETNLIAFLQTNKEEISSLLISCGVPYIEFSTIDLFYQCLTSRSCKAIISICDLKDYVSTYPQLTNNPNVFIVASKTTVSHNSQSNTYNALREFILSARPPASFIQNIIELELDKLNISKSYTGFKYLLDYITYSYLNNLQYCYSYEVFNKIATLNQTSPGNVERDIRHMLSCNLKNNATIKLKLLNKFNDKLNTKKILLILTKYIQNLL